ncbi:MAG TPA: chemotaxis protein CheC [Fimbriimonadaceae bacterium]|nr:chemotaxis protein CheC [Fimbriimonadaceae bacterium]HRJ33588.1 chemotaxis protein CheC [Fimbriimonadaceae bacterium]
MPSTPRNFGEVQLSAIYEMANIGLGNAMTALSEVTGQPFNMTIPRVEFLPSDQVPLLLGGDEVPTVAVYMPIAGQVEGHIAFLFPWESAKRLWNMLLGQAPESVADIGELEASAMLEIGNMLNSSFLNALADMTQMQMHATPPLVAAEMSYAILSTLATEAALSQSTALAIETRLECSTDEIQGVFVCLPTIESIEKMLSALGLAEAA